MVYSPSLDRDVKFGTSSSVLFQDLPRDPDLIVEAVSLVAEDGVASRGVLYRKRGRVCATAAHLLHPRADHSNNYIAHALVQAGFDVLARGSRWVNNDIHTVHEVLLLDMAAGVRFLREERGYTDVVLVGNSGGSTLATFYQEQAELQPPNRLRTTPAGDDYDLNAKDLPPASAVALIGAHAGEGQVLLKWIDPSVVDEADPLSCDPSIDMYDPRNGYRHPPEPSKYSAEFLAAYRAAQHARVARIDALAKSWIAEQKDVNSAFESDVDSISETAAGRLRRRAGAGRLIVVYRTAADPNFLDLSLDPDERLLGTTAGARPQAENYAADGLGRVVTPQAWLSTWSAISTRADTARNVRGVRAPTVLVHYAGDNGMTIREARNIHAAMAASDKSLVVIPGVEHYGFPLDNRARGRLRSSKGTDALIDWLRARFES